MVTQTNYVITQSYTVSCNRTKTITSQSNNCLLQQKISADKISLNIILKKLVCQEIPTRMPTHIGTQDSHVRWVLTHDLAKVHQCLLVSSFCCLFHEKLSIGWTHSILSTSRAHARLYTDVDKYFCLKLEFNLSSI